MPQYSQGLSTPLPEHSQSPSSSRQPPSPVILKAAERRRLQERFQARVDSVSSSTDTMQRLLRGYSSVSTAPKVQEVSVAPPRRLSRTPTPSIRDDPAQIRRPQAPEPISLSSDPYQGYQGSPDPPSYSYQESPDPTSYPYQDSAEAPSTVDLQRENDHLHAENASLRQQLEAALRTSSSSSGTTAASDMRVMNHRVTRLQRRLDEYDAIITASAGQIHVLTGERETLEAEVEALGGELEAAHRMVGDLLCQNSGIRQTRNRYADIIRSLTGPEESD